MSTDDPIPQHITDELLKRFHRTHSYHKPLLDRLVAYALIPPDAEYLSLASICLHDLADLLQRSEKAIYLAHRAWIGNQQYVESPELWASVHLSRYHFDYAAISLCAASNHLASSMWHLEEKIPKPLGKSYKSASQVAAEWSKLNSVCPSRPILETLLSSRSWVTISDYRNEIIHRGLPVIEGEFRQARRTVWQSPNDPPPGPFLMMATAPDGRVCYLVHNDITTLKMPDLLAAAEDALSNLLSAVDAYLAVHDAAYVPYRVTFT